MRQVPAILLVDNEQGMLVLFGNLIRRQGYEVWTAGSGEEALARLNRDIPDLLILDMAMPGISGLDVLRDVAQHPELDAMPIVVLTAIGPGPAPADVAHRIARWVAKPLEPQALIRLVRDLVGDESNPPGQG